MQDYQPAKILSLLILLLLTACSSTQQSHITRITIPNPGKYELVQYFPAKDFPNYNLTTVDGREFLTTDDVVMPSMQSIYLLSHWDIKQGESVLDLGTGSGIQAIFAADNAGHIVATDINHAAVKVAKLNIERHGLSNIVEVRQGDLFGPINDGESFNVILFNINYPHDESSQGLWKLHKRFFAEVEKYLKPGGRIYYQSGLLSNIKKINTMAANNQLQILSMRMDATLHADREPIVYLIMRKADIEAVVKLNPYENRVQRVSDINVE